MSEESDDENNNDLYVISDNSDDDEDEDVYTMQEQQPETYQSKIGNDWTTTRTSFENFQHMAIIEMEPDQLEPQDYFKTFFPKSIIDM